MDDKDIDNRNKLFKMLMIIEDVQRDLQENESKEVVSREYLETLVLHLTDIINS